MVSLGIGQVKERIDYFFHEGDDSGMGLEEHGAREAFLVVDIYFCGGGSKLITVLFCFWGGRLTVEGVNSLD